MGVDDAGIVVNVDATLSSVVGNASVVVRVDATVDGAAGPNVRFVIVLLYRGKLDVDSRIS